MKALVECLIKNAGGGFREVQFTIDESGKYQSCILVSFSACRDLDGTPIGASWPPKWTASGEPVIVRGLVEVEITVPSLITLDFQGDQRPYARPGHVHLIGQRGHPKYRLVVVGNVEDVDDMKSGRLSP